MCVCVKERETERERQRDRETQANRDRQRDLETQKQSRCTWRYTHTSRYITTAQRHHYFLFHSFMLGRCSQTYY